jgi:hypothetical protein
MTKTMRKEMFELNIGERFTANGAVFVCIRMYGEYDNVLAIQEDTKRIMKFQPYARCEFLPTQAVEPVEAGALDVNDVVRMADDKNNFNSETFLILENEGDFSEVRAKVLETGDITSINPYAMVKVLTHGNS